MSHAIDIIIPSMDNYNYLLPLLQSIVSQNVTQGLAHITVVNNGHRQSCDFIDNEMVTVLQPGENLGWEGALKLGLAKTKAPFVMFLNDDTLVPVSSRLWLNTLLQKFIDPRVGAVGPSSNTVMGLQNIFTQVTPHVFPVKFLIGFCFLVRREALDKAGGIDDRLPGGDDLDMSIRLRKAGYTLLCDREVFVYHHGFTTGTRVHGSLNQRNGWNSYEMLESTNHALITKHGFKEWWDCTKGAWELPTFDYQETRLDSEGEAIRALLPKDGVIVDVGCGNNKTTPNAIGIDMVPTGTVIETLSGSPPSVADIVADVSQPLPIEEGTVDVLIARHILEHLMDFVTILKGWHKTLKLGGKLIIAVPNNGIILSIPMNYEHCVGYNPQSLKALVEVCGFRVTQQIDPKNGVSFITVAEKI